MTMTAEQELDALAKGKPTPMVTYDEAELLPLHRDDAKQLVSATFMSRTGDTRPHIVTLRPDGVVQCTCEAYGPCWAQRAFRMIVGMYV